MNKEECFAVWAPTDVVWARWAKPVLFTGLDPLLRLPEPDLEDWSVPEASRLPARHDLAVVVDLPGLEAVRTGVALAGLGYRPVPLFNATDGLNAVLDVRPVMLRLVSGAPRIAEQHLRVDAPPAFLLDADRMHPQVTPAPGRFDNRWITLPQDFPSATFLMAHGVTEALLLQRGRNVPQQDLAHVLRRWQEGGLRLLTLHLDRSGDPEPLQIEPPSLFRRAWYRAVAVMGLQRNNVGGFGSVVPEQSGGGFYG